MDQIVRRGETDNCRGRLIKYCSGQGLDLGCGFTKIKTDAIGIDLTSPIADMNIDARILKEYPDELFDFVYSSHLLEEIEDTEMTLREWLRVVKPGGYVVLYQPDKDYYFPLGSSQCNSSHKIHFYWQELWAIFEKIGGTKLVHYDRMGGKTKEWSFELVVQKTGEKIEESAPISQNIPAENPICTLSVLLCSCSPNNHVREILQLLNEQSKGFPAKVEFIYDIESPDPIGKKRNWGLNKAKGKYIVFIDDSLQISNKYLQTILDAVETDPDVVGFHLSVKNGDVTQDVVQSYAYADTIRDGNRIFRYPNHLNPVRRSIALAAGFPEKSPREDIAFAANIFKELKKESFIEEPLYYLEGTTL